MDKIKGDSLLMKSHFAFDMRVQSDYLILAYLFLHDDVTPFITVRSVPSNLGFTDLPPTQKGKKKYNSENVLTGNQRY